MKKMLNVGLTGNRFSGKNGVSLLFSKCRIPVFDADSVLKYLLNYKKDIYNSVKTKFGAEYVMKDYINPLAFNNDEKFNKLIDVTEFQLFEAYDRFKLKNKGAAYTIFHSSLIFEKNYSKKFDYVINIFSPIDERMYRYKIQTDSTIEKVHNLFSKEITDLEKNNMSDFVIHNYENSPDVLKQVEDIDVKIVDKYLALNKFVKDDIFFNDDVDLKSIYAY